MTLDKLFITKQSIIIYKIENTFVRNRVFFSTNVLPVARKTIASLLD